MTTLPVRYRRLLLSLLGTRTTADLPANITAAVEEQENRGEILVRLIQLAIVALWGVLFYIAPQPAAGRLALAPYVFAIYAVINAIGLFWATRHRLPAWSIYVSTFLDMLLLFAVMWSAHIQYGQPPALYLKAPTLNYIFVFISLRALRFDPRFVLTAGFFAALGWAGMLLYVLLATPGGPPLTEHYLDYLTGDGVMLSAELNKIITIVLVTCILALALHRARGLLVQATEETAAARSLSRFFDNSVAQNIRKGSAVITAGEGVAREAAILNVDIRGFSRLVQEMPPAEAIQLLSRYQRRVVPILQGHGGVIDKFLGDGIMATFGAVHPSATFAADALRAVEALLDEAASWAGDDAMQRLAAAGIGISAAAGPIVFGVVGDHDRLEVTVIGATVNLAAKLEKANKALGSDAVVTRAAFDLAHQQGYRPTRSALLIDATVDGISGEVPVAIWRPALLAAGSA